MITDVISNVTDKDVMNSLIQFIQNNLTLTPTERQMLSNQPAHSEIKSYILNLLNSVNQSTFYDLYFELIINPLEIIQNIGCMLEKITASKERKRPEG